VFLVLEDEFGLVSVVVKPTIHERQRSLVRTEPFVIVRGELQRRDGMLLASLISRLSSTEKSCLLHCCP
jgi:DNA polymerase III alpha subunit